MFQNIHLFAVCLERTRVEPSASIREINPMRLSTAWRAFPVVLFITLQFHFQAR